MLELLSNPAFSTVLIALITGIFSVITIRIQKNQDKMIEKIDEQTVFIEKEKAIRQRLVQAEKKRDGVIEQMTILSMKINIQLINAISNVDPRIVEDLKQTSSELETSYKESSEVIKDISREYEIMISVSNAYQKEFEKLQQQQKKK